MAVLGIDFGTSNTAAGVVQNGKPQLIELENGADTLPTVIFMDFDSGETLFGQAAVTAMTEGRDGRFCTFAERLPPPPPRFSERINYASYIKPLTLL